MHVSHAFLFVLGMATAGAIALLVIVAIRRRFAALSREIADANRCFRATFEQPAVGSVHLDLEGRWLRVNDRFCTMTGYRREELLQMSVRAITHPDDVPFTDAALESMLSGASDHILVQKRYIRKDGSILWGQTTGSIVRDSAGRPDFFVGTVADIGAHKNTEAQLVGSEAHFAAIYAQPGAAVAETDLRRRFVSANDRYCELVGRSREALLKLGMQDVVYPEDLRETGPLFERLVATGEPFTVEKRYVRADGAIAWVMSTASLVKLEGAEPTILVVAIDVTERRQAEIALRASEERLRLLQNEFAHLARVNDLGEMAAAIAHEINQPLTAIVNYLNTGLLIAAESHSENAFAEAEQIMRDASAQALRAGDIVRRLRDFVGTGDGVRTVERAEALVDSAMALALIDARSSGIAVDRSEGIGDAAVEVDAVQIQQVLVNLLRNAVEALGGSHRRPKPRLTVSTRLGEEGVLQFIVADNGPGIAAKLAGRIFEPFMTTKPKGMGMGLSVCRRLVESHGGTIGVESEPGAGATFCFTLPQFTAGKANDRKA